MFGIALQGGGTRGAYHIGALKAIFESDIKVGGIVGTSIGSFNGAVAAQGDFDKLYKLWSSGSSRMVLDISERELIKFAKKKVDFDSIIYWSKYVIDGLNKKGLDAEKLRTLYSEYIDEKKLMSSKIDYGMVTYSLTDKKPIYMYKKDIPKGQVADFVLASSYLPVFKQEKFKDDKNYIDGGIYDNCPIQMLLNKGYSDIIEIRTEAIGIERKVDRKNTNIYTVRPTKDLGNFMFSDNAKMRRNIQIGYFDALRVLKGYIGYKFYVKPATEASVFKKIYGLSKEKIQGIVKGSKLEKTCSSMDAKKFLLQLLIPSIELKLKDKIYNMSTYQNFIVSMIEYVFTEDEINMFKVYTFNELLKIAISKSYLKLMKEEKKIVKNYTLITVLRFITSFNAEKK